MVKDLLGSDPEGDAGMEERGQVGFAHVLPHHARDRFLSISRGSRSVSGGGLTRAPVWISSRSSFHTAVDVGG